MCLPENLLLKAYETASHLYFLDRGAINITIVSKETEQVKGKGKANRRSRRMRPVETPGSFLCMYDPLEVRSTLPLDFTAVKLVQLLGISRNDLLQILDVIGETEAMALLTELSNEVRVRVGVIERTAPNTAPYTTTELSIEVRPHSTLHHHTLHHHRALQ